MDEDAAAEPVKVAADGGQQQQAFDDPRIPWTGKPGRTDILCWAGIMLSGIFYWAILPFRASLVGTHPVLLELLNGSTEAIVAAAAFARIGHGSLIVVLPVAIPGLMKFDPLFWWAGRLWGERVIALFGGRRNRGARYMARVQRWGRKFTWPRWSAGARCRRWPGPSCGTRTPRPAGFGGAGPATIFRVGSVTKVFTALLLADMAERGEVHLSDPAARAAPRSAHRATSAPAGAVCATGPRSRRRIRALP